MASAGTPVVFVHGLWLHADSWGAWVDLFREAGYAPQAPGWPGDSDTVEETDGRIGFDKDAGCRPVERSPFLVGASYTPAATTDWVQDLRARALRQLGRSRASASAGRRSRGRASPRPVSRPPPPRA